MMFKKNILPKIIVHPLIINGIFDHQLEQHSKASAEILDRLKTKLIIVYREAVLARGVFSKLFCKDPSLADLSLLLNEIFGSSYLQAPIKITNWKHFIVGETHTVYCNLSVEASELLNIYELRQDKLNDKIEEVSFEDLLEELYLKNE